MEESPERRLVREEAGQHYSAAEKRAAYDLWRSSGRSLQKVGEELGIADRTIRSWSAQEGWVTKRERDDARDEALALARLKRAVVAKADAYLKNMDALAESAESESTRLAANTTLLKAIGFGVKSGEATTGHAPLPPLDEGDAAAIEAMFRET